MTVPDASPLSAAVALGERLRLTGRTLATAESLTGGRVANALVAVEGSREWLQGGIVAYASSVKHAVLGVPPGPVVSREAALEMASAARRIMSADVAIATTGCAGPEPFEGQPPGTVWIAVAIDDDAEAREFQFAGDPEAVCTRAVEAAIAYAAARLDSARPVPSSDSVESRAKLTPEEEAAGSDDPRRQAAAILEESSARILGSDGQSEPVERRTSADTVEPLDQT
jgi:nicotinamide-nucleotide amidase